MPISDSLASHTTKRMGASLALKVKYFKIYVQMENCQYKVEPGLKEDTIQFNFIQLKVQ